MFKKGTKTYSIFKNKCPRCHEGDFYVKKKPFQLKDNLKIYTNCSVCDLKYMIEPSFFYGAMYVSYGLTIAFSVAIFIICHFLGLDLLSSFIAIVIALIILTPVTMRLSRMIYINMFIHYKEFTPKK